MNYPENPVLEFFGFGKPKSVSYNQICMLSSNALVSFLKSCINCVNKFKRPDEDDWETSWYEYCIEIAYPLQKKLASEFLSVGFPKQVIKLVEYDIFYLFRDNLKYCMLGSIKEDLMALKKSILKYNNKPYQIFDKSALKQELSKYNVELVD